MTLCRRNHQLSASICWRILWWREDLFRRLAVLSCKSGCIYGMKSRRREEGGSVEALWWEWERFIQRNPIDIMYIGDIFAHYFLHTGFLVISIFFINWLRDASWNRLKKRRMHILSVAIIDWPDVYVSLVENKFYIEYVHVGTQCAT